MRRIVKQNRRKMTPGSNEFSIFPSLREAKRRSNPYVLVARWIASLLYEIESGTHYPVTTRRMI
jgi:hypothetical protein